MSSRANLSGSERWPRSCRIVGRESMAATWVGLAAAPVPEFERALFRLGPTGILPEVVKTRYGFHLVAADKRIAGNILPFEAVRERVAERLRQSV